MTTPAPTTLEPTATTADPTLTTPTPTTQDPTATSPPPTDTTAGGSPADAKRFEDLNAAAPSTDSSTSAADTSAEPATGP